MSEHDEEAQRFAEWQEHIHAESECEYREQQEHDARATERARIVDADEGAHAYTVHIGTPDRHWSDDGFCDDAPIRADSPAKAMRKRVDAFAGEVVEVYVFGPPEPGVYCWMAFEIVEGER